MSVECERLGGINLAQGVCDTPAPQVVREAAQAAIRDGKNQYVRLDGIAPLRSAIAGKLERFNRIHADPEREILVTSGATGAFHAACMALLDPGDEVLVFEPFYSYHVNTLLCRRRGARICAAEGARMATRSRRAARSDLRRARGRSSSILRAIPAARSFRATSLGKSQSSRARTTSSSSPTRSTNILSMRARTSLSPRCPEMRERTITISGFSKTFSVTGWRIGYLACDARWKQAIAYFHDLLYVCAPSPLQFGVDRRAAAAGRRILSPACVGLPRQAGAPVRRFAYGGIDADRSAGRLLCACRRFGAAGRGQQSEGDVSARASRRSPPFRGTRSFMMKAAAICCASVSRRPIRSRLSLREVGARPRLCRRSREHVTRRGAVVLLERRARFGDLPGDRQTRRLCTRML